MAVSSHSALPALNRRHLRRSSRRIWIKGMKLWWKMKKNIYAPVWAPFRPSICCSTGFFT